MPVPHPGRDTVHARTGFPGEPPQLRRHGRAVLAGGDARYPPPPPNRRSSLARRRSPLLLLAAALAALAVFFVDHAPPASAEHTGNRTVWSATLTAGDLGSQEIGFDSAAAVGTLSDGSITYDGMVYDILGVFVDATGELTIWFSAETPPTSLKSPPSAPALTLNVGNSQSDLRQFALADAALTNSDTRLVWNNTGLSWEEGDTVRLWLTVKISEIGPLPTMSASISGDPVEGGEAVTLTLTLSEPVDVATSMQRRVGGTADSYTPSPNPNAQNPQPGIPGDYDWVTIPTFPAGGTTATTQIRAVDDNEVEGCETITWFMTMWPGTYRAVHLFYKVYIEDNDGGTPCVVLKAQDGVPGALTLHAPTDYVVPGYAKPAGSPGSAGDGAAGGLLPAPESGQAPGQAPRGTAGQAPDAQQGDGNHGNSDPPPSGETTQGVPESPSGGAPEPEPTPEQTAEERLIAEIAGDDGCISQDERMAGATRIQKADLTTINQSQAYRMFRAAYC